MAKSATKSNVIRDLFFIGVIRDGSECWHMYEYTHTPNRLGSPEMLAVGVSCSPWPLPILTTAMTIIMIKATHLMSVVKICKYFVFCTLKNANGPNVTVKMAKKTR